MLRIIAAFVGLLFPLAGAGLALFISGVEPERPLSPMFVSELAGVGLVLGLGFLVFAFLPRRKLHQSSLLRSLCVVGLALPFLAAVYFILVAAFPVKLVWLVIGGVCIACGLSLRNPETKYA
jgi:hypothetical protein